MPRSMRTGLRSVWESASSPWRIAALSEPSHATAHSHRSATIGSTFVARRPGKYQAAVATISSNSEIPTYTPGWSRSLQRASSPSHGSATVQPPVRRSVPRPSALHLLAALSPARQAALPQAPYGFPFLAYAGLPHATAPRTIPGKPGTMLAARTHQLPQSTPGLRHPAPPSGPPAARYPTPAALDPSPARPTGWHSLLRLRLPARSSGSYSSSSGRKSLPLHSAKSSGGFCRQLALKLD